MHRRFLTIQSKIALLAGLCLVLVVGLLMGLSLYQTHKSSQQVAQASSDMLADAARNTCRPWVKCRPCKCNAPSCRPTNSARDCRGICCTCRQLQQQGHLTRQQLRQELSTQLQQALIDKPDLLGLYVVPEPDALDGADSGFAGKPDLGSNETGRFSLYWVQGKPGEATSGDRR